MIIQKTSNSRIGEFDPENIAEDFMIEDILLRAFQEGRLQRQSPAFPIDYYALKDKWAAKTIEN